MARKVRIGGPERSRCAHQVLGLRWRAAVEPLVEIKHERFFRELEESQAGRRHEVDEHAASEVARMGLIARDFDCVMVFGDRRVGVSDVIRKNEYAARLQQLNLPRQKRRGIDDVVQDVPR